MTFFSDAELPTPEEDLHHMQDTLEKEKERMNLIRLQLAKKNRAIVSIERKLDNIPDRTELAQYQRRFIELYGQGNSNYFQCKCQQLIKSDEHRFCHQF